jgi:hypothetical protein
MVLLGVGSSLDHSHHFHQHLRRESSYPEIDFSLRFVTTPLLWDMEEMYGATNWPWQYLGVVGTIELDDFI